MLRFIQRQIAAYRFRHMTRHFDAAEREARRQHKPVKHIQAARKAFVHSALRGEA
jgi:hypothetical protein